MFRSIIRNSATVCAIFLVPYQLLSQDLQSQYSESMMVKVINQLDQSREDAMVRLSMEDLKRSHPDFNTSAFVIIDGPTEVASQISKDNKSILLVLDKIGAKESRNLSIIFNKEGQLKRDYPKRTQAELSHKVGGEFENRKYIGGNFKNLDSLRVPDEHTDHSNFIRYEGPGWESDKVGYRFYLDWRNAIDVFGKKTNEAILQKVGLDGFDSYHEMQEWGMDVMKVGKALGVGSLAYFHENKANRVDKTDSLVAIVRENGNEYSEIETQYYGWQIAGQKLDLISRLGIHAGSRMTHHLVSIEKGSPDHLSTGINKDKNAKMFFDKGNGTSWGYLASYGNQSLNDDGLGIAVLFSPNDLLEATEDELNHVVKLKPNANKVQYYFLAAWVLEPDGIQNETEFLQYIQKTARELASPLEVRILKDKRNKKAQSRNK